MNHLPMPTFGPLAGVRVVFSGIEIAGPFAGQMFAEWGAEVIWIETSHGPIPSAYSLTTRSSHAATCTPCR